MITCGQKINLNRLLSLGCKSQIEVCNVLFEDERNGRGTCDLCMHISRDCLGSKTPAKSLFACREEKWAQRGLLLRSPVPLRYTLS